MLDHSIGDGFFPAFRFTHIRARKFDSAKDGAAIDGRKEREELGWIDGAQFEAGGGSCSERVQLPADCWRLL
jgi:hypothetical protein